MLLSPLLEGYDNVILDLDGCVYVGAEATPGAVGAIACLREAGKGVAFATNDPRLAPEEYVRRLWGLGVRVSGGEVVTVGAAVQHHLHQRRAGSSAFVVGTPALRRHVSDAGLRVVNDGPDAPRAEVVVVGGTEDLVYSDLRDASLAVRAGAELLATGRDSTYPMPDGLWPGTGAIVVAIEYATGRTAELVGKPAPGLFRTALDRLGPGRTLAVGDRLDADVAAASAAGIDAALVLSGATSAEEASARGLAGENEGPRTPGEPRPVAVGATLAELIGRPGPTKAV